MKALCFDKFGDPSVLEYREVPDPVLKSGELLVQMQAIGLNFADVYRRKGNYHLVGKPPYIAGYEGAGIVINANQHPDFKEGDRIAFADVPFANAELVAVPATHAIPLPDDIEFETAAALLLQGLTAQYLTRDSHRIVPGEVVLVHAAAGGVGQLLIQICKLFGAKVIGLTSSPYKQQVAMSAGADLGVLYGESWKASVRIFTGGRGVNVAYDSVGSTLSDTFEVTMERGHVVFYGMSGGDPAPVDPRMLMDTSKTLSGGDLWSYLTSHSERVRRAYELFEWVRSGKLMPGTVTKFSLAEGRKAHELLESRRSTGKILLIP